ncbi:MAG TPA: hypothetical protein VGN14_00385 [Candidatus Elarobacter sp.]
MSATTAATIAYQAGGSSTTVRALSTTTTDSNGVIYATTYGSNNGALTVLPETGSFSNDAKLSYLETDPGLSSLDANGNVQAVTIDREANADGSYTQTNGAVSAAGNLVNNVTVGNPDFSAKLSLNSIAGGRIFTFSPPSGGTITYTYYNGATKGTTPATVPNWIPASQTKPSIETDTITPGATLDASCKLGASFAGTPTAVKQVITTADPAFGTLETRTTTSYDAPGGTECTVVSDTIQIFYDYSSQEGPAPRLFPSGSATTPVESITVNETVAAQSLTLPSDSSRSAQSSGVGVLLPRSLFSEHVAHIARQEALRRLASLRGGSL